MSVDIDHKARILAVRRIAGAILFAIALFEGIPLILFGGNLGRVLGRPQTSVAFAGALLVSTAYIFYSVRNVGVRSHLGDRSWVRVPAVMVAIVAGIFEELFFRRTLMDGFRENGQSVVLQILCSGATFGAAHAFWGIRAGWRVVLGVSLATGALGTLLAILYIIAGRNVVPCVEAHVVIDLVLEPALMLNAVEAAFIRRNTWAPVE